MGLVGAKGELSNIIEIMENAKKKKKWRTFSHKSLFTLLNQSFFSLMETN